MEVPESSSLAPTTARKFRTRFCPKQIIQNRNTAGLALLVIWNVHFSKYGIHFASEESLNRIASCIDHFHKWWPIINSFVSIKISLTDLILKLIIQKKFYSETRLVRLI